MIVADSDVLIDSLRGHSPGSDRVAAELRTRSLATTVVSVFELRAGAKTEREQRRVDTLLAALTVRPLSESAARRAARARRALEGRGQGIGMADYLIAGICLEHSAALLTRNHEHFGRVPGLSLATLG